MPAQTSEAILSLCMRKLNRGDEMVKIASDAKISAWTIYRAKANLRRSGNVVQWPHGVGRPSVLDHIIINISKFLLNLIFN